MDEQNHLNSSLSEHVRLLSQEESLQEPEVQRGLLSPVDRVSETLYGLIMTLTFTCTLNIAAAERTRVSQMLYAAIGCNVAWGLVDGLMYVLTEDAGRRHKLKILSFIQRTPSPERARKVISDELQPLIGQDLETDTLENIRQELLRAPKLPAESISKLKDLITALAIFVYAVLSTFPVAIPFLLFRDTWWALRISNFVAIVMMFFCGWYLGRYIGRKPLFTGCMMSLIGIVLVGIAISLGG